MNRVSLVVLLWCGVAAAGEPVVGAGDEAARSAQQAKEAVREPANETVVSDKKTWADNALIGTNQQPRWTDRRRFPGTRVYVAPPGAITAEFWVEAKVPSDGSPSRLRTLYELSIGLPFRFQIDLYLRLEHTGLEPVKLESERVEVRWALAPWGVIPGNPTLYLEWIRQTEGPQKLEGKLLLGGSITDRLYWGANLFFERELWGTDLSNEYGVTAGLSYSLKERTLSMGAELRVEIVDLRDQRFQPSSMEFLIGPTFSFQPLEGAHILVALFCGPELERDDVTGPFTSVFVFQPTLVGGWRF